MFRRSGRLYIRYRRIVRRSLNSCVSLIWFLHSRSLAELRIEAKRRGIKNLLRWVSEQLASVRADDPAFYNLWIESAETKVSWSVDLRKWYAFTDIDKSLNLNVGKRLTGELYSDTDHLGRRIRSRLEQADELYFLFHSDSQQPIVDRLGLVCTNQGDVYFGDEDQLVAGSRQRPLFKGQFSQDLFINHDIYSDFFVVTRSMLQRVANLLPHIRCSQELLGILVEQNCDVTYVPHVISHRLVPRSELVVHKTMDESNVGLISIIIPARDQLELTRRCVDSVFAKNKMHDIEIILLDNGSQDPDMLEWLASTDATNQKFRLVRDEFEFNWSRLNNLGVANSCGEHLIFLNNDTESHCSGWASRMASYAARPGIGVVGTRLLYPDGTIQHAGVVCGMGGCAGHVYSAFDMSKPCGPFLSPNLTRNVTAVTGACMSVSRDRYLQAGGFNESYRVSGSDVVFCLDLLNLGYRNVYYAGVEMIHYESASRRGDPAGDVTMLLQRIEQTLDFIDPYYPRSLSYEYRTPILSSGLWQ